MVDGKAYVIGGWEPSNDSVLPTVHEYDPATDTWAKKADMPTARYMLATCTVNKKIYAIGGYDFTTDGVKAVVEVYDPKTDTWEKKDDMPTPRLWIIGSVVNERIYLISGSKDGGFAPVPTVEEYTPEGWPFAMSVQDKLASKWGEIKRGKRG